MSQCKIHNIRFYNLEPRSIGCLCYEESSKKLALSRVCNSIEIWNVANAPFLESTIRNSPGDSIESIVWINNERILATGILGIFKEYDVTSLSMKYEVALTGGAAYCMSLNPTKTRVAVGTEEGYINTFSVTVDGMIYEKIFDKQNGRILCIQWDNTGDMIFTGSTDIIRVWNSVSGHAVHRLTTSRDKRSKGTIVWCLGVTADNHIVSGDSRGILSIWDPVVGVRIESHQSHSADICALTMSQDKNVLYCAGVDQVIRSFSKVAKSASTVGGKTTSRWVRGIERRLHTHPVRALIEADGKLYSAGDDGYLAQSSYPPKTLTKYPPLLQPTCVTVCRKSRCVLLRYVNYLELWKLGKAAKEKENISSGMTYALESGPTKLLKLQSKGNETINSCAITDDSKIIVYSTETHMRLFNFDINNGDAHLLKREINHPLARVQKLLFSPDNKLLVCVTYEKHDGSKLSVFKVSNDCLNFEGAFDTMKQKLKNIRLICFSPDNKYLICADQNGTVVAFEIDDRFAEGSSEWWALPMYTCPPTVMAVGQSTCNLVIAYSDHKVVEYNLPRRMFTAFSNGLQNRIPSYWLARPFPITNITFDPNNKDVIILHDDTSVYVIRKDIELTPENSQTKIRKQMINGDDDSNSSSTIQGQQLIQVTKKYKHLVHLEWFDDKEIVAVEVNPISLTEKLPPRVPEKRFVK